LFQTLLCFTTCRYSYFTSR